MSQKRFILRDRVFFLEEGAVQNRWPVFDMDDHRCVQLGLRMPDYFQYPKDLQKI